MECALSLCCIEGCEKPSRAAGMCWKHYERVKRYGDPNGGRQNHGPIQERFKTKFEPGAENECWNWLGAMTGNGYGAIQEAGKGSRLLLAHRVSYEIHKGPIPDGLLVMHACDNRRCVNPFHLSVGTQSQNILDAFARGRKHSKSKMTPEQVRAIRESDKSHRALAEEFGCSRALVYGIKTGRTWKNVA